MRATTTRPTGKGGHRNKGALAHPMAPPCARNVTWMRPNGDFLYTKPPKPPNFGHIGAIGVGEGIPERRHEFRSATWGAGGGPAAATLRTAQPHRYGRDTDPRRALGGGGEPIYLMSLWGALLAGSCTAPRSAHRMP